MSVNIDLTFTITGLTDEAQAITVTEALDTLLKAESIANQVSAGWINDNGTYFITGEFDFPLCISRFYLWRPHFESAFQEVLTETAPNAEHSLEWGYPDEES